MSSWWYWVIMVLVVLQDHLSHLLLHSSHKLLLLIQLNVSVNCLCSVEVTVYVTESTKTGLIAYRQVLRKVGFNYSKCCSSLMAEATSIEFHTLYNNTLLLKPSSSQVDKKQVSHHFR